jgi:hypothetical protein
MNQEQSAGLMIKDVTPTLHFKDDAAAFLIEFLKELTPEGFITALDWTPEKIIQLTILEP